MLCQSLGPSPGFTERLILQLLGPRLLSLPVQRGSRVETGLCRQDCEEEEVGVAFKLRPGGWEVGSWREEPLGLSQNQQTLPLMD